MGEFAIRIAKRGIIAPLGMRAAGVYCGIKGQMPEVGGQKKQKNEEKDLALIKSEVPARAAGVFTQNKLKSPSVLVSKENLKGGLIQAVVVNSGNANCCTGKKGMEDARMMAKITAKELRVNEKQVIVASTGIIGQPLPFNLIKKGIKKAGKELSASSPIKKEATSRGIEEAEKLNAKGVFDAAEAIMTTDKIPKAVAVDFEIDKKRVSIGAIAKGSGMLSPNLATMLCFIATDAVISRECLKRSLKWAVDKSFNLITVDGDTSPSDMVIILANGLAKNKEIREGSKEFNKFYAALYTVTFILARFMVVDGEGATKSIDVVVKNAKTFSQAEKVARSIANSNLVKTALFGADPNWGRIMTAVGYAGVELDINKVDIYFDKIKVAGKGNAFPFNEKEVKEMLEEEEVKVTVDLNSGKAEATVLTCDLSYEYVKINAEYRT